MQISKTQKSIKNAIIQTKKHLHQYKCKYKILLIFLQEYEGGGYNQKAH